MRRYVGSTAASAPTSTSTAVRVGFSRPAARPAAAQAIDSALQLGTCSLREHDRRLRR
jgi:hypothetical protein